tara:strand:+ start:18555 stop:19043 length:489 start_codon:yes stop_codon:yes gene_type:complete
MAFSSSKITAITGATGAQGPAGNDGADGADGAQGPQGPAGSVNTATDYTWTGSNRATPAGENDGSFDLDNGQNFTCTPSAAVTLTFTSDTSGGGSGALSSTQSGQSGFILLDNGSTAKAHTSASTTFHDAEFLTTIGGTGKYLISYLCDGTNVYCSTTKVLT